MANEPWSRRPRSPQEIERVAAALGDPVKSKLLIFLTIRPGSGVSELARWSRESEPLVRRHLKIMIDLGLAGVTEEESRRGVTKRYYVGVFEPIITEEADTHLSERNRRKLALGILRLLLNAATESLSTGILTARQDRVTANTFGEVDESGWTELARIHAELLERVQDVVAQSRERLAQGDEAPISIVSGLILVELPPLR